MASDFSLLAFSDAGMLANTGLNPNYDLAPDGKRIVTLMRAEAPEDQKAQNHVIFLQNFFDEVRRRAMAAGK